MELVNATTLQAQTMVAADARGRERVVAIVKGTFTLPKGEGEPTLAEEQLPLVEEDTFTGDPGMSATIYESDYVPFKPRCDVLLHGSAHAPGSKPAKHVRVALNIGRMLKGFDVVGDRVWTKPTLGFKLASDPVPFVRQPITYERAFGGMDEHPKEPGKVTHYETNPIGVGYYPYAKSKHLEGRLLPTTAEIDSKADSPKGQYQPMGFGPIGRNFQPRARFAGTYDERWMDEDFPFLPADFDPTYFQSAPLDQQIPYPKGGERIVLRNLTPKGRSVFLLPRLAVPVEFNCRRARRNTTNAVIDTIIIEPDEGRLLVTWRASQFLQRSIHEVRQVVVGHMPQPWYEARDEAEVEAPPFPVVEKVEPPEPEAPPAEEPPVAEPSIEVEPPRPEVEKPALPVEMPAPPVEELPAAPPAPAEEVVASVPVQIVAPPIPAASLEPAAPSSPEPVAPPSAPSADMSKTQVLSDESADKVEEALRKVEDTREEEEEDLTATHTWERLAATQDLPELSALLDEVEEEEEEEEEEDLTATLSWDVAPWDSGPPIPDDLLDDEEEDPTLYRAPGPTLDESDAQPPEAPRESQESEEEFTATMMSMPSDVSKMLSDVLEARDSRDEEALEEVGADDEVSEPPRVRPADEPVSTPPEDDDEMVETIPEGTEREPSEPEVVGEGITDTVVEVPEAVKALLDSIDEPDDDDDDDDPTVARPSGSAKDEEE